MSVVTAPLADGREVTTETFADLTDVPVTDIRWDPDAHLVVEFAADLDAQTRRRVRIRIMFPPADEQLVTQIWSRYTDTVGSIDVGGRVRRCEDLIQMLLKLLLREQDS